MLETAPIVAIGNDPEKLRIVMDILHDELKVSVTPFLYILEHERDTTRILEMISKIAPSACFIIILGLTEEISREEIVAHPQIHDLVELDEDAAELRSRKKQILSRLKRAMNESKKLQIAKYLDESRNTHE